ncbi:MAG: hypothetical protein NZ957_05815 [Thaumarchaeota archaeon]|nr:hypothetical protein [Candidatus Calditenuaceae archaeon]
MTDWDFPLLKFLSSRTTIVLPKPIVSGLLEGQYGFQSYEIGYQTQLMIPHIGAVDLGLEEKLEEKRKSWTKRGYPEHLQDSAIRLAYKWTERVLRDQLERHYGEMTEQEYLAFAKDMAASVFKIALDHVVENWLRSVSRQWRV